MKTVKPTIYYLALESDYVQSDKNGLFRDMKGNVIYRAAKSFKDAAAIEGSARLIDGRVIHYAGGKRGDERFHFLNNAPWGMGAKCPLVPLKSIAVDPKLIPLGSTVFIPKTVGISMPDGSKHDGIWYAIDVGGAIKGDRIDIFAGAGKASMKLIYNAGIDHLVPIEYEIQGMMDSCPTENISQEIAKVEDSTLDEKTKIINRMIEVYSSFVGQSEDQGANRSVLVDKINKFMGVALGSPYCLSGLQYGADQIEKEFGCNFNIPLTAHCQTFYQKCPDSLKFKDPKVGDWAIYKRIGSSNGHACFVHEVLAHGKIKTIEFNTGAENFMNRDGGGVYSKIRNINGYGVMQLMGFVRVINSIVKVLPTQLA